jgi:hypothetical protein
MPNTFVDFFYFFIFYSICKTIRSFQNLAKLTYYRRGSWRLGTAGPRRLGHCSTATTAVRVSRFSKNRNFFL